MKKGKRIASVVLVLAMLLSMFTVVNAAETTLEPVTYRCFLYNSGSINSGSLGNEYPNLARLQNANGITKLESKTWWGEGKLPNDSGDSGMKFEIKAASYGNEELMLNAITTLNPEYQPLPMFAYDNARVEIDVWSTAKDPANYPTGMGMQISGGGAANAWPSVKTSYDWKPEAWNRYSIPLKELLKEAGVSKDRNDAKAFRYRVFMPATVTEDFDIYFRNFKVVYDPSINVNALASVSGKKVTLTYEPYGGITADSYDIYRDGKPVAENVTETAYIDATTAANTEYTYTVNAKLNGEVVATSETTVTTSRSSVVVNTYIGAGGPTNRIISGGDQEYDGGNAYAMGIMNDGGAHVNSDTSVVEFKEPWGISSQMVLTAEEKASLGSGVGYGMHIKPNAMAGNATMRMEINNKRKTKKNDNGSWSSEGMVPYTDFMTLPTDKWDSAYLTFEVWDSAGNYPTSVAMPIEGQDSAGETKMSSDKVVQVTTEYKTGKWNHVEIPLSAFMSKREKASFPRVNFFFGGHNNDNAESNFFIRNVKICYASGVEVSTTAAFNKVTLNLAPYDVEPESYTIYRGGEKIAEGVTGATYTDTVNGIGSYDYTVEVIADGDAVAEGKASVMVYPFNREKDSEMADFLSKDGNSSFDNIAFTYDVATPSIADFAPQTGGFSWKWNYDINNEKLTNITAADLAQQYRFAADSKIAIQPGQNLELMIYTDAESKDKLPKGISVFYNNDENSYGICDLKDRIELGKWNYISIPASKLGVTEDDIDGRIINRIEILSDSLAGAEKSFNVYVANMGISQEDLSVTANISDSEIIVNCSSTVDGSYKLFKNNSETPLFERTQSEFDVNGSYIETITEYGVTNKYTLNRYDENGNLSSSAECSVKVDAPAEGIILAVVGNEPVNECSASDNVTVRAYPAKGSAESFVVMAATYAADGSLLKAENVTDGSFVPTTAGKVKFMIIDGTANLVPLANAKTLIVK